MSDSINNHMNGIGEESGSPQPAKKQKKCLQVATNVTEQQHNITREFRAKHLGTRSGFHGCTVWLTGLSGAGKTSIAFALEAYLVGQGIPAYGLDGDNIRSGLNRNLGFSQADREENVRRVAEVAKLFADSGTVTICSFLSPFADDRDLARKVHRDCGLRFYEIFIDTPLEVCESRDVRGLYKKARAGSIQGFTGVTQPYEVPVQPDLVVKTDDRSIRESTQSIIELLIAQQVIPRPAASAVDRVPELFARDAQQAAAWQTETDELPGLDIGTVELQWVQVLSEGWAHPLRGFMREDQYLHCLHHYSVQGDDKLTNYNQSVPVVLAVSAADRDRLANAEAIVLKHNERPVAILRRPEFFAHRKAERCARQFGTVHPDHPYVRLINESGEWCVGGELDVLERIRWHDGLDEYRLTPNELRQRFAALHSDAVFAFQLRNPIHNGHALLMSDCRRQLLERGYRNPVLLLHPLGGWTKDDDVPLAVRIAQHRAVLDAGVLCAENTVLAIFPSPMMYAGPTEVEWHAKARMNAGAAFYIVGRDPAGVPHPDGSGTDLYDGTHGARVLRMAPGLDRLEIIPFRVAAYDRPAGRMAFFDAQRRADFEFISGTKMRGLARAGEQPPDGFMEPKAWAILSEYYQSLKGV